MSPSIYVFVGTTCSIQSYRRVLFNESCRKAYAFVHVDDERIWWHEAVIEVQAGQWAIHCG